MNNMDKLEAAISGATVTMTDAQMLAICTDDGPAFYCLADIGSWATIHNLQHTYNEENQKHTFSKIS